MKEKYAGSGFTLYYKSRTKKGKTNLKACSKDWNNLPETEKEKYKALSSELNEQFFEAKKKLKIENNIKEEGAQTDGQWRNDKEIFTPGKLHIGNNFHLQIKPEVIPRKFLNINQSPFRLELYKMNQNK